MRNIRNSITLRTLQNCPPDSRFTVRRDFFSAACGCAIAASVFFSASAANANAQTSSSQPSKVTPPTLVASANADNAPLNRDKSGNLIKDAGDRSTGPALNPSLHAIDDREPVMGAASPVVETNGPLHTCDDGVSAAMLQDAPSLPCWANIRTVDHWNTMFIPEGVSFHEAASTHAPKDVPSSFAYTAGGLSAYGFPDASQPKVYGGLLAGAGLIEKQRWQLMVEDAGGAGDYQLGGAHFAKLNRFALRATGEVTNRWSWQGNATNTYGTDGLRLFAPLDYRMIGNSEVPAAETVVYGLHAGEVVDQEEGLKLRFADTERSHWDFSGAHTYRHFTDDGFTTQTVRGRAEYLHALTRDTAVGIYGDAAHQSNVLNCSLGGGGVRYLAQWTERASLNVSGGVEGATASCGNRAQFTGDAALYYSFNAHNDVYVSANRGLSDGALEQAVFLDTASMGLRHTFHRQIAVRLTETALHGVDPNSLNGVKNRSMHGTFTEVSMRYPLGMGFSQEAAFRHYAVSGLPTEPNRSIATFTLWWSPAKRYETASK